MKPKLCIEQDSNELYFIAWSFDGDIGGALGESTYDESELAKCEPEDRPHIIATITASRTDGVSEHGYKGYRWETDKHARDALRAIKAAIKNDVAPWPEWAIKATAAGWKAPKGWKP